MSLIFGVNLSDRLYLAADCRVTRYKDNKDGTTTTSYLDNINKTERITNDIVVAAAGNAHLAGYLIHSIKKEVFLDKGIQEVRRVIKKWIAKKVDEYLSLYPYASASLIFAGVNREKKKHINGKKIISLVGDFQRTMSTPMSMKDVIFKGISAKPNEPNPEPELPISDTLLFGIRTDAKNSILELEDTNWGEYLAYGPKGFTREDVPKGLFGQLEFEHGCGNPFRDQCLLTAFIKSTAEIKKLGTVGGSVVVMMVNEELGHGLLTNVVYRIKKDGKQEVISETIVKDGKLMGRTEMGIFTHLISLSHYKYKKDSYEL